MRAPDHRRQTGRRLALSFDVECYYQIVAKDFLGRAIPPTDEVLKNTSWILDLLGEAGKKATFFFLGNVADRFPELVQRAVSEGHEIGVHGDVHDYVRDMDQPQFRAEIERGMSKIRAAGAQRIAGHRATAFSISRRNAGDRIRWSRRRSSSDSEGRPVPAAFRRSRQMGQRNG